jgi:Rps23 Pro-64 3,4-dihydroxylase Tpa1-like proline 4-hydroxylase
MLNHDLDIDPVQKALNRQGRTRIAGILEADVAEALYERLMQPLPWDLCLNGRSGPEALSNRQLARLTPQQNIVLQQQINAQAQRGFAFQYARLDLIPGDPPPAFRALRDLFASRQFLSLMQNVTQDFELERADGQVTMYQPGCFLKTHGIFTAVRTAVTRMY